MAQFTRVNGDLKPVLRLDDDAYSNSGANAVVDGAVVQPQGPKLDFFTATANGALTGSEVAAGIQAIQQLGTIHMYQYDDETDDTLSFAIYPAGQYSTAELVVALEDAGWANAVTVTASATFTSLS